MHTVLFLISTRIFFPKHAIQIIRFLEKRNSDLGGTPNHAQKQGIKNHQIVWEKKVIFKNYGILKISSQFTVVYFNQENHDWACF